MPDWQPIETAPKDGSFVLLTGGHPSIHHWVIGPLPPMVVAFYLDDDDEEWVMSWFDTDCGTVAYNQATHWMPLPEPPQ